MCAFIDASSTTAAFMASVLNLVVKSPLVLFAVQEVCRLPSISLTNKACPCSKISIFQGFSLLNQVLATRTWFRSGHARDAWQTYISPCDPRDLWSHLSFQFWPFKTCRESFHDNLWSEQQFGLLHQLLYGAGALAFIYSTNPSSWASSAFIWSSWLTLDTVLSMRWSSCLLVWGRTTWACLLTKLAFWLFTTSGSCCWPPFAANAHWQWWTVEVEAVLWIALRGFGFSVCAVASLGSMFVLGSIVLGIVLGQLQAGHLTEVMVPVLVISIVWCSSTMTANLLTSVVLAVIVVWTTHRIWDLRSVPSNSTDWWGSFGCFDRLTWKGN